MGKTKIVWNSKKDLEDLTILNPEFVLNKIAEKDIQNHAGSAINVTEEIVANICISWSRQLYIKCLIINKRYIIIIAQGIIPR